MYLSKKKLKLVKKKFCVKYSYETYLALHSLNMTRLRKTELHEWLNRIETIETEKYFKTIFLEIFKYKDHLRKHKKKRK